LLVSFLCVIGGFLANALALQRLLMTANIDIHFSRSVAMMGLNIFGKYIPGKIWVIMGRALYIAEKCNHPVADVSFVLLKGQLISVWCGLAFGMCGLVVIDALGYVSWLGLGIFAVFTLTLFSQRIQSMTLGAVNRVFRKTYHLPEIDLITSLAMTPWFMWGWVLWGCGFAFMAQSMLAQVMPLTTVFGFPLAGTLGIVLIFAPGGIGIRESILTGYLVLVNVSISDAVTLSAVSRLWFLLGEAVIFGMGYLASRASDASTDNDPAEAGDDS
jgi:hypothetical protein